MLFRTSICAFRIAMQILFHSDNVYCLFICHKSEYNRAYHQFVQSYLEKSMVGFGKTLPSNRYIIDSIKNFIFVTISMAQ